MGRNALSLQGRMGAGFGLLLILMLVFVGFALDRLAALDATTQRIASEQWQRALATNEIVGLANANGRAVLELFVVDNPEPILGRIEANRRAIDLRLEQLARIGFPPASRELFDAFVSAWRAWAESFTQVGHRAGAGDRVAALQMLETETLSRFDRLSEVGMSLKRYEAGELALAVDASRDAYHAARNMMFALILVSGVAAIGVAVWIVRSVLRPLGGEPALATEIVRRIASGDLDGEIPLHARDDDSLLAAMADMQRQLRETIAELRAHAAINGTRSVSGDRGADRDGAATSGGDGDPAAAPRETAGDQAANATLGSPRVAATQAVPIAQIAAAIRSSAHRSRLLAQALSQSDDAVVITDVDGRIEYANPAYERASGYTLDELIGHTAGLLDVQLHTPEFSATLWRTIRSGQVFRGEFTTRRRSGEIFHEEKTITPIRGAGGRIVHFVATAKDVTEQVTVRRQLERLANYDSLTGLPNRSLFLDRLTQAIRHAERREESVALLFVDLDRFKVINDTLGHSVGDELLQQSAVRLMRCVRAGDTVARLGGDEFTVILEGIDGEDGAARVGEAIQTAFENSFALAEQDVYVTPSVGVALYPRDGRDVETLLKRADIAMYRAKRGGRNSLCFYDRSMDAKSRQDLSLETALRGALQRNELAVAYQPILDAGSGQIVAVEALMRWNSGEYGAVPPVQFIPLLEETGLIGAASRWLLQTASGEIAALQRELGRPLRLAVNISGTQFRDPSLVPDVLAALEKSGLEPDRLELEITETTLMEHEGVTLPALKALSDHGIRVVVDDFGTGYSSLSYLVRLPVGALKVDRSFVNEVAVSEASATVVNAIVSMATGLGLEVVIEGVENEQQLTALSAFGCHRFQGFLFSAPVALEALKLKLAVGPPQAADARGAGPPDAGGKV